MSPTSLAPPARYAKTASATMYTQVPSVEPSPAICSRRRFGLRKTEPKARTDSAIPRRAATVSEDGSLCCKCEGRVGRFRLRPSSWGGQRRQDAQKLPTRRDTMSDEARAGHEEDQDEVEAHRRALLANEEAKSDDDGDGDDDVEAHRRVTNA